MCIAIREPDVGQRRERPLDGDQVDDDLDGVDPALVGVGPAGDLVEVVADPRDLPGALALDLGRWGGPRPRARHGLPQQGRQRNAGGGSLGPRVGELGRRHAGGDGGGAALGHQDAPPRGKGGKAPIRELHRSADLGGFEGGRSHPSPAPMYDIG